MRNSISGSDKWSIVSNSVLPPRIFNIIYGRSIEGCPKSVASMHENMSMNLYNQLAKANQNN